jgi:ankyrin repeat protein
MALVLAPRPGEPGSKPEGEEARFRQDLAKLCVRGYADEVIRCLDSEEAIEVASGGLDGQESSALHLAVLGSHLAFTRDLIARGCRVDARDSQGRTPLHLAALEGSPELTLELLQARADANIADVFKGQTALHYVLLSTGAEATETLKVLLSFSDGDVSLRDNFGMTPLAVASELGHLDHVAALLEKDPSQSAVPNHQYWTPLHLASHGLQKVKNSKKPLKFPAVLQLLLDAKAVPDANDENCKTALHRAATAGAAESAAVLIGGGASLAAADECRWTPLHHACNEGHLGVAKVLLEAKAKPSEENPSCLTPLAVATIENQVRMVELLMKHKGDPHCKAKGLQSPVMIARKEPSKYSDILALFEIGFIHHAD